MSRKTRDLLYGVVDLLDLYGALTNKELEIITSAFYHYLVNYPDTKQYANEFFQMAEHYGEQND